MSESKKSAAKSPTATTSRTPTQRQATKRVEDGDAQRTATRQRNLQSRAKKLDAIAGKCDIEKARESFLVASSHAHILNIH